MARVYREAYRSYPDLLRAIMTRSLYYNRTMEQIERLEEEGRIFVLRPQVKTVSRLERNAEILTGFYEHGYHLMGREYDRLTEYLER